MSLEDKHTFIKAMETREILRAIHIDFINDYLTPAKYAEHNGLSLEIATALLYLARETYNSQHPEA